MEPISVPEYLPGTGRGRLAEPPSHRACTQMPSPLRGSARGASGDDELHGLGGIHGTGTTNHVNTFRQISIAIGRFLCAAPRSAAT
jgi:hypothetical protein